MEIDPDPEKQRCEGILSATSSAGADVGSRVRKQQQCFHVNFCDVFNTKLLGNRHGQPTNGADAVKISGGGGTNNRHGKYQGIDSW